MKGLRNHAVTALGWVTLASLALLVWLGLSKSPPDAVQSDAVRLFYLHVPAAWVAMFVAFPVTALASLLYLYPRTRSRVWDHIAGASAELGVLFTGLTLVLGSLWGRPVWGVWWAWDARIVSTAVLFFLYLGYLALRRVPADPDVRARRCAVAGIVAALDVPIVYFSVYWWRTLHQQGTVFNPERNPEIHGTMASALLVGVLAFTLLYAYLLERRYRLAELDDGLEERMLAAAIAERRSEATPADTTTRATLGAR
jgi:heme exporter protein C